MTVSEYESHTHTRLRTCLKTPFLGIDVRRSVAWALGREGLSDDAYKRAGGPTMLP